MEATKLHKDKVGRYAYDNAQTLVTQLKQGLEQKLFEYSNDGTKVLRSTGANILTSYKSGVAIKKRDVIQHLKDAATEASTEENTVEPEITDGEEAQLEEDRKNAYRLEMIGVKEGVAAEISKLISTAITNPILYGTKHKGADSPQERK